uniref:Secreted protein n=1 Tax=Zea mays TaxID=4577 RepID=C4J3Q1_MAIZE|nr:unknown [Zea mays]ACR36252.1 unknown [Zea mays]
MSCIMVLGTAFLMPSCATASTKRLCSCGVHTRRGRLSVRAGSSPPPPPPPPLDPAADDAPPPLMSGTGPAPPAPCVVMSKATARSGVMSVCVSGISSSGRGSCCSCSSPRANQLGSSSSLMAAASSSALS